MVTVPREYGAQVQARPIADVRQNAAGADLGAFGSAGVGAAAPGIQQFADHMAAAGQRIQARNDAVANAKHAGDFEQFGADDWIARQQTDDISNPAAVKSYLDGLDAKAQELMDNYAGSADGQARLAVRLQELRSGFLSQASAASAEAGRKAVVDQLGVTLNKRVAQVAADPSQFQNVLALWNSDVDGMTNALTPEEERVQRRAGPSAFVQATFDNILMQPNGDMEAVKLLQNNPSIVSLLTPQEQGNLQQRIRMVAQANAAERNKTTVLGQGQVLVNGQGQVVARGPAAPRAQTEGEKVLEKLSLYNALTKKEATPEMVAKLMGMDVNGGVQSLTQKAEDFKTAYRGVTGRDPDAQQWDKFFGVDQPQGQQTLTAKVAEVQAILKANGTTLDEPGLKHLLGIGDDPTKTLKQKLDEAAIALGRPLKEPEIAALGNFYVAPKDPQPGPDLESDAISVFASGAERFSKAEMTPQEEREFLGTVTHYTQPTQWTDPDTGLLQTRRNALPEYVKKALTARGYDVKQFESQTEQPAGADGGVSGNSQANVSGNAQQQATAAQPTMDQLASQSAAQPQAASQAAPERQPTIYEMAPLVTGPVATVAGAIGTTAVVGGGFPEEVTAQSQVSTAQGSIISALRNVDTRYLNETERQQLETKLDITGKFLGDIQGYQQHLIGIDKDLENRLDNALQTAANPKTTKEARQAALDAINTIRQVREMLLPPRFDTVQEAVEYSEKHPSVPILIKVGDKYILSDRKAKGQQ